MNKSLSDLKAALDYAREKYIEYSKLSSGFNSEGLHVNEKFYWKNKIDELEKMIEESVNLLEG